MLQGVSPTPGRGALGPVFSLLDQVARFRSARTPAQVCLTGTRWNQRADARRPGGQVLDRERPLWEITFVEGLDSMPGLSKGSFALVTRLNHAAVDGKASTEMMTALLDTTPAIRVIEGEDDWSPESLPSVLTYTDNCEAKT